MTVRRALITVLSAWLLFVGVMVVHDAAVPVEREWSTGMLLGAIGEYREHVSPRLRGRVQCRFTPTCSKYGLESVRRHGAVRGSLRAANRILRCGPWTPPGTVDAP